MVRAMNTPVTDRNMDRMHSAENIPLFPDMRRTSFVSANNSFRPFGFRLFRVRLIRLFMDGFSCRQKAASPSTKEKGDNPRRRKLPVTARKHARVNKIVNGLNLQSLHFGLQKGCTSDRASPYAKSCCWALNDMPFSRRRFSSPSEGGSTFS